MTLADALERATGSAPSLLASCERVRLHAIGEGLSTAVDRADAQIASLLLATVPGAEAARSTLQAAIDAADARARLDRHLAVYAADLAALAGLSDQHVRRLVRDGEIPARRHAIDPHDARLWLAARGVRGYP